MKKQVLFSIISILILIGFTVEVCVIVQNNRVKKAELSGSIRVTIPIMEHESTTTTKPTVDDTFIVAPARVSLDDVTTTTTTKTTKKKTTTKTTTAIIKVPITGTTKERYTTGPNKTVPVRTTEPTTKAEPQIVNVTYSEENQTYYKYGVKITNTSTYMVVTYDNGEVRRKFMSSRQQFDKSGFNANAMEMKSEAMEVVVNNKDIINEIVDITNYYRTGIGDNEVAYNEELSIAATVRAMEMAYSGSVYDISHTRPNKKEWYTVITDLRYKFGKYLAENIAAGYISANDVTAEWYRSEGHRKNMLNNRYNEIGVGYYELDGSKFWVQLYSN